MALDTDKLLDRVRKLLALAESPNVHEAAAAAGRAQALITRHQLQGLLEAADEAEQAIDDGRDTPLEVARKLRKWKIVLASGLAHANGCEAYTVEVSRREQHLCVMGRAEDREAVTALWEWLLKRLEWLSATHGAGEDRDWHESFRIGAAETISERLADVQQAERSSLASAEGQHALVRIDQAMAARTQAVARYAETELRLKKGRSISVRGDAHAAGREAGAAMPLPSSTPDES